jgi:hypothetical protein
MFDGLWATLMSAGPHVVLKDGAEVTSPVPDLRYSSHRPNVPGQSAQNARWFIQVRGGHVANYVRMWKGACQDVYSKKNKKAWTKFEDIVDPLTDDSDSEGELDEPAIIQTVQRLTTARVNSLQIRDVTEACLAVWTE